MHSILKHFSNQRLLAVAATLILSFLLAILGSSALRSPAVVAPLSNVVIEETLASEPMPVPSKPGDPQPLGWTAWSG